MNGHTPTPWKLSLGNYEHDIIGAPWGDGRAHDGMLFVASCECSSSYRTDAETKANAEFIVRAANAHEELVAALEALVRQCPDWCAGLPAARAALAKAAA